LTVIMRKDGGFGKASSCWFDTASTPQKNQMDPLRSIDYEQFKNQTLPDFRICYNQYHGYASC
jgi:hypothetical protein